MVYVKDINQLSLPNSFNSVLVSISVFMAHSAVFHSINSPDNSPLSLCSSGLIMPYSSFQKICISVVHHHDSYRSVEVLYKLSDHVIVVHIEKVVKKIKKKRKRISYAQV